jgi:hypothetical protein
MTLRTLFSIPVAIILLVTLSLAGMIMGQGWSDLVRGKQAVEMVERMRMLLQLQNDLRVERIAANLALGLSNPLPEPVVSRMHAARVETDRQAAAIVAHESLVRVAVSEAPDGVPRGQYLDSTMAGLRRGRAMVDDLLAHEQRERSFPATKAAMSLMFSTSGFLEPPLERASGAVISVDPGLASLVVMERLTVALRDQIGVIASLILPRLNTREPLTAADMERLRILLGRAEYLTQLLGNLFSIAGGNERMRTALVDLEKVDSTEVNRRLNESLDSGASRSPRDGEFSPVQKIIVAWGERVNLLRGAIVDATVERVTDGQIAGERQFDIVVTAFGLVMIAITESVVLLTHRVVAPLAQLGLAITRIAAGDRSVALKLNPGTLEIAEMVTAVETLRQAALVADAAARRQQWAARQRLTVLREALVIARTVRDPARALERGVASLSEGIDATIALIGTSPNHPTMTLRAAATAVRAGLAEMRGSAAELEATLASAGSEQTDDWPEAEFVAHILAVKAQVDRRDAAVSGFIQPSLMALRDAAGEVQTPDLRDLVSDQFEHIETTVATVASMRDAVMRAAKIVRELPLEDTKLAA